MFLNGKQIIRFLELIYIQFLFEMLISVIL